MISNKVTINVIVLKINSIDLNNHINLNGYNKMIKKIETNTKHNNEVRSFSNNFNMPSKPLLI